jgi:hypothetical protein
VDQDQQATAIDGLLALKLEPEEAKVFILKD